eukprot:1146033-Pelagomonas_calceolata.AAC.1
MEADQPNSLAEVVTVEQAERPNYLAEGQTPLSPPIVTIGRKKVLWRTKVIDDATVVKRKEMMKDRKNAKTNGRIQWDKVWRC